MIASLEGLRSAAGVDGDEIPREKVLEMIKELCETAGIPWTELLGRHMLHDISQRWEIPEDRALTLKEVVCVVDHFKSVPRHIARESAKVAVLGGGAFGTAMANALARRKYDVVILMRPEEQDHIHSINEKHINTMCFADVILEPTLRATMEAKEALEGCSLVCHAIPVQFSARFLKSIKEHIPPNAPIVSTSKGISVETLEYMDNIIESVMGDHPTAYLSGPSFAQGVLIGDPTIFTLASKKAEVARQVQEMLCSSDVKCYTTTDVTGVLVVSALKNVLAIALGLALGLGLGPNTQCALLARGWKDIRALCLAHGGSSDTLNGLSGLGDLTMTCFGGMSRNAKFGGFLAQGQSKEEALKSVGQVVEGLPTAGAISRLAKKLNVKIPVLHAVNEMLEGRLGPRDLISFIMALPFENEFA
uniref:Glycerol-3-phosphate dehydrogenase [NAD(+)] n=1 Tax=Compsopogon caeruleus TaxID=31354 RepID=A0A7S1T6M6_9RHOD|mmetsp:Transcript_11788/g.24026  ORF Transcript_11788/g.24026 Transcript_11788/m.24026 type:complete len:419 (+) Transcript_11788:147-1403(+)|eukprot:CAMPEP_0184681540 /NCGR_PEP_ID=MMETSP0312-20130426/4524_1 /TAXON_ID=31354 /ORGANISM="Compsopogon coeruleus, Strain SAG 36.94" /LENGTH=418 /DNA_ID=CAMNT_0027132459 /DNA_START=83 /DNA_END=1339 /DNA_ORIENTATION=-